MCVVYCAEDLKLKRTVALKFLPPELTRDAGAIQRFIHEAQAASSLQHNNICTVHDIDETDDRQLFIVMDCYEGEPLKLRIAEGGMRIEEAVDIAIQVASGLLNAHEKGIVHRDIKPANIIITNDGVVKILDFGLAKLAGQSRLTKTGSTIGTAAYMSPEQAQGFEVDHRTDIWSLGVVLFEMLTGKLPFRGEHEAALLYSIVHEEPQAISTFRAEISRSVISVIERALQKDRSQRYQTVNELVSELKSAMAPTVELPKQEKSIVVLPFQNLSPDPDQEYFSDGLTEEVISDLSAVQALRVISRSSAMTFKGTKKKIPDVAREVNVQYVLEGSVRKAGNNLRITAQLIDATNDAHLWAEKYSGTLDDVFDIQEKVSRSIVNALRLTLTSEEEGRMSERPIADVRAFEWYLKAMEDLESFTEEGIGRAEGYLHRALEITGPNAQVYAGLAFVHWQRVNLGFSHEDSIAKAENYVEKALALDPGAPTALALRGWIEMSFRADVQKSLRIMKRVLALRTDEKLALAGLICAYLQYAGKGEPAALLVDRLEQVDPLNFMTLWSRGALWYYGAVDFDRAVVAWGRLQNLEPGNYVGAWYHGVALASVGRIAEARSALEPLRCGTFDHAMYRCGRMLANALADDATAVEAEFTPGFQRTAARDAGYAYHSAQALALAGLHAKAIEWLEIAQQRGFIGCNLLARDPLLAGLRGEERFMKLLKLMKKEWEEFEA
jgi:serine/threonine protein kinase/Flp pilus assembly protein TadD